LLYCVRAKLDAQRFTNEAATDKRPAPPSARVGLSLRNASIMAGSWTHVPEHESEHRSLLGKRCRSKKRCGRPKNNAKLPFAPREFERLKRVSLTI
jgi:hypothetical protein